MSPSGSTLLFQAIPTQLKLSPADKRALKAFARQLSDQLAGSRTFICLLSNDHKLQQLNLNFLGHDYPTDVLSFPAPPNSVGLGELAISLERAAIQAADHGHALLDEIRILMLHGVLHLTGLDHEDGSPAMERAEKRWRREFNLPEGLISRARKGVA